MRIIVAVVMSLCLAASAFGDNIGFDFLVGGWALGSNAYSGYSASGGSTKGGPMIGVDFRAPGSTAAYEAAFSYRRYNGTVASNSVMGLENRVPIYFTSEPLRIYAAPSLGFWQMKYGLDLPAIYGSGDSDFALSLGGGLGLRIVGSQTGSFLDLGYFYQGTKVVGPDGFFASRRIIRGKGNLAITDKTGFTIEAGAVEEGWYFISRVGNDYEYLGTLEAGSPYIMFGPTFSF